MTCAKRIVRCTIITSQGVAYVGENSCGTPQNVCPRKRNEGYKKCKTICNQEDHAEIQALKKMEAFGASALGATAFIHGIDHLCKECARALSKAGVAEIILRRSL